MHQTGTVFTTTSGWRGGEKYTVVKDQDADKTNSFAMPAAQIPDTLDNKDVSDAVLVAGKISVLKGSHILPEELHDAIVHHDLAAVKGMLQGIPDLVFSKVEGGATALDLAALVNDIPIMKLLLANKAAVSARDDSAGPGSLDRFCLFLSGGSVFWVRLPLVPAGGGSIPDRAFAPSGWSAVGGCCRTRCSVRARPEPR